ncbi:hypothetical protein H8B09_16520 [Paenibacillus sp. PR3]|uniref:Uncharacterized protein n=1 Tax=Paenibacillus terricola TaxID=2763503 RepID=A0ABR8MWN6_9BACL|nr:hypothetical protein [Paenibacillus terricola]MBD3920368.1 hypothetical protein [Paenibacillus terricola]
MGKEMMESEAVNANKKFWVIPKLEVLEIKHTNAEEWEFVESPEGFWKRQLAIS